MNNPLSSQNQALSAKQKKLSDKQKKLSEPAILSESKIDSTLLLQQIAQAAALNQQHQQQDDEIDLAELWRAIWSGKWLIIAITSLFAAAAVAYALSLPNIYKSEALLAPAQEQSGGGMASQLGGLASLAGISLGGGGSLDSTALAIEIMKSRIFVTKFINDHDLLVPLMATKGWDQNSNQLIYNEQAYDVSDQKWLREVKAPFTPQPSAQEAYKALSAIVNISQDKISSMVTISVKHYSPAVAKQWVDWLIDAINLEMKTRDLTEAHKSISYLEQQLGKTRLSDLQNVLYEIIEEQTKTIMFAEVREQYAFKTIDPALVPELKDGPKRALICVLGVLLGGMLAVMFVLIRYFSKK
ncbi:MAG: LPS O-antigen length regulator [Gammaproteobacteria bacterium]|nr:LPS O-antigen length regulator [Gammaproteobacteria bacterium]